MAVKLNRNSSKCEKNPQTLPTIQHHSRLLPWVLFPAFFAASSALTLPVMLKGCSFSTAKPPPQSCDTFVVVGKTAT
eukprot:2441020-Rhodomonas_salina.1